MVSLSAEFVKEMERGTFSENCWIPSDVGSFLRHLGRLQKGTFGCFNKNPKRPHVGRLDQLPGPGDLRCQRSWAETL